jgi:hypothetical protein
MWKALEWFLWSKKEFDPSLLLEVAVDRGQTPDLAMKITWLAAGLKLIWICVQ